VYNVDLSNGRILAYIGDAVLTLKVREFLVTQGITKAKALQAESARYISAKAQAKVVAALLAEGKLDETAERVYHLGRNYKAHSKAKNVDIQTYKMASGLEALWGYYYLSDNPQQLKRLWDKTRTIVEQGL